jgi:chaperonin GroEL
MSYKIIKRGRKARQSIKNGVEEVYLNVRPTIGHGGRNAIFKEKDYEYKSPLITNDGISIARETRLKNEIEMLGAEAITEIGNKQEKRAGDTTTGAMIMGAKIYLDAVKEIDGEQTVEMLGKPKNTRPVLEITKEINENKEKVLKAIDKVTLKAETKEELIQVATTSMQHEELGKTIGEIIHKIGKDGTITVEEALFPETSTDIVSGMRFYTKLPSPELSNTENKRGAKLKNTEVLVYNGRIGGALEMQNAVTEAIKKQRKHLVVLCAGFEKPAIQTIIATNQQSAFQVIGIVAPSLNEDEWGDVATFTGAFLFDASSKPISGAKFEDLGYINSLITDNNSTALLGGKGEKSEELKKRLKEAKAKMKSEESDTLRKLMKKRIASLSSGIGVIRVGANTDQERVYLKRKVDDAVLTTQLAFNSGTIKGGGLVLKEIAEKLPKSIITEALKEPYNAIKENAGVDKLEIQEEIKDSAESIKLAVEHSCSGAGMLLTVETAMADIRPQTELQEAIKELTKLLKK